MRFVMECIGSFDIFMKPVLGTWVVFYHYVISSCNTFFDLQVLMFLGRQALRKVIENAELYPIRGSFSLKDFFPERLVIIILEYMVMSLVFILDGNLWMNFTR